MVARLSWSPIRSALARVGPLIFGVFLMLVSSSKAQNPLPRDGDFNRYVREVNPKGETVWQFTQADAPEYKLGNFQTANRLANGNTLITCWVAGDDDTSHWPGTAQVIEVTPAKKIVWAMASWKDPDLGPATSIQLLDEPGIPEDFESGR